MRKAISLCAFLILLALPAPILAESRTVYQLDASGRLTPYIVDKAPGETRVYNLNTGEVGISQKDGLGDTWNLKTGRGRPDPVMDSLLNDGGDGNE